MTKKWLCLGPIQNYGEKQSTLQWLLRRTIPISTKLMGPNYIFCSYNVKEINKMKKNLELGLLKSQVDDLPIDMFTIHIHIQK